jgi:hypothetical protein
MDALTQSRNLNDVQRGVETALRNVAGRGTNDDDIAEPVAMDRLDKIGNMSALAIAEASETTAREITGAAQAAVDVAAELMREAEQLAADLRANGQKISEHLREFATFAKRVSTAMRDTRTEVLNRTEEHT